MQAAGEKGQRRQAKANTRQTIHHAPRKENVVGELLLEGVEFAEVINMPREIHKWRRQKCQGNLDGTHYELLKELNVA